MNNSEKTLEDLRQAQVTKVRQWQDATKVLPTHGQVVEIPPLCIGGGVATIATYFDTGWSVVVNNEKFRPHHVLWWRPLV